VATFAGDMEADSFVFRNGAGVVRGYLSTATSGSLAMQDSSQNDRVRVFGTGVYIDGGNNGLVTIEGSGTTDAFSVDTARAALRTDVTICGTSSNLLFFSSGYPGGATKQTVTGSRGGNAALASLLTALASYGLITNSST
jgi:hypothetical protein